jgi:hypothetical protein
MRIASVDFPLELLAARRSGRLVVFAGAGVSMPAPSCLPDFKSLAEEIAAKYPPLAPAPSETPDRHLSRLDHAGFSVHQEASRIIGNPSSHPNQLHHLLAELFLQREHLRIVTTNFDRHFEKPISDRWSSSPPDVYAAPALPVGSRFSGLAYVHGRYCGNPRDLVLTDRDFGRAYLTEGWARRFLAEIFTTYDVLFIGYSHQDMIVSYLARGLQPTDDCRRFALASPGDRDRWQVLGITPIEYDDAHGHAALPEALSRWVMMEKKGALGHERSVQRLVEHPPETLSEEDQDYLLHFCLPDPKLAQFFYRHADHPAWLTWAARRSVLRPLFDAGDDTPELSLARAAQWFARDPLSARGEIAREIAQPATAMSRRLWHTLAHQIWRALDATVLPLEATEHAARWLTLLERHAHPDYESHLIGYWLKHVSRPEHAFLAMQLFTYLARPVAATELGFRRLAEGDFGEYLRPVVRIRADRFAFSRDWASLFKPNLDRFALPLAPTVFAHLHQAHLLLRGQGAATDELDPWSSLRPAIEPHEQNEHPSPEAFAVLIDAARDILDWMMREDKPLACAYVQLALSTGAPLLRRVAIYGLHRDPELSADQKISRVISGRWLRQMSLRHETFLLLREAYGLARSTVREQLIQEAELAAASHSPDPDPSFSAKADAYEFFTTLTWLAGSDPECPLLARSLDVLRRQYPEFEGVTLPHPDFRSWSHGVQAVQIVSPMSVDEILGLGPQAWVARFDQVAAAGRPPLVLENPVYGFLQESGAAAARDFDWGLLLAEYVAAKELWDHPVWHHLLRGWASEPLDELHWGRLMSFLRQSSDLSQHAGEITELLAKRVERTDSPATENMLMAALPLAEALWATLAAKGGRDPSDGDWLQRAFSRPAGQLAQFATYSLWRLFALREATWAGIPAPFHPLLDQMLVAPAGSSPLARVVLSSRLHSFFRIDADWTRANLFPLFDWSRDRIAAEHAWHGFLPSSHFSPGLLADFMPLVIQTFGHLADLGSKRSSFSELLVAIAFVASANPLDAGWIRDYLLNAAPEDLASWAVTLGRRLAKFECGERYRLWNAWIRRYLEFRLDSGIPIDTSEWSATIDWSLPLAGILPELLPLFARHPAPPSLVDTVFFNRLLDHDNLLDHPDAAADLLVYLLTPRDYLADCDPVISTVEKLHAAGASRERLLKVADILAALGCHSAGELAARIDPTY